MPHLIRFFVGLVPQRKHYEIRIYSVFSLVTSKSSEETLQIPVSFKHVSLEVRRKFLVSSEYGMVSDVYSVLGFRV